MIKVIVIPVEKMITRSSGSFGDSVILFTFGADQTTTAIDFPVHSHTFLLDARSR